MIDIDELEALAKAATPGPWRGDRIDGTVKYDIVAGDYPNGDYTVVCHGDNGNACDGGYGFTSAENEGYVLAANPAAILALIAEVRALREDAERWKTEMSLRNDPAVAIMFVGTENRCNIYRRGELIASGETYVDAIDAARKEKA